MNKEGRKIKSLPPMNMAAVYFMPNRNGASNKFSYEIDITQTEKYIREKRSCGLKGLGLMHIVLAAYTHTVSEYPGVNRFIRGQRTYARNSIEICLTIKKEMSLNADETVVKFLPKPDSTIFDIYNSVEKTVAENKEKENQNDMDSIAGVIRYIPGVFLKFAIWFLKTLDYFNMLPSFLIKASPFHGSMFITNMGSLGVPPIYHHLYDFGNIPIFISLGMKKTAYVTNKDGETEKHKFVGMNIVCDERICDGHYYATAFKNFKRYIEKAWLLENPPKEIKEDIR